MASTPDEIQLQELFTSSVRETNKGQYAHSQWKYMKDQNQGTYTNNIVFDFETIKKQRTVLRDTFLQIPYKIKSASATPLAQTDVLGWKGSNLSLIGGLVLHHVGSSTIINENFNGAMSVINNIRLLTESDYDLYESELRQLGFFKDDTTAIDGTKYTVSSGNVTGDNANYNSAVPKRKASMGLTWNNTTKEFSGTAIIPLKYLHDFFDKMDFPVSNVHFRLELLLNTYGSGSSMPCIFGGSATEDMQVTIDASKSCYMWYRSVNFKGEDEAKFMSEINNGLTKTIKFVSTECVRRIQANADQDAEILISTSMRNPLRVWALPATTGDINSAANANSNENLTPMVITNSLENYNLVIDGTPYYEQNINNGGGKDFESFKLLQQELPSSGRSLIAYDEFLTKYRYYPINICRGKDKFDGSSRTVSLTWRGKSSNQNTEYVFLIEKLNTVAINMTVGTSEVISS